MSETLLNLGFVDLAAWTSDGDENHLPARRATERTELGSTYGTRFSVRPGRQGSRHEKTAPGMTKGGDGSPGPGEWGLSKNGPGSLPAKGKAGCRSRWELRPSANSPVRHCAAASVVTEMTFHPEPRPLCSDEPTDERVPISHRPSSDLGLNCPLMEEIETRVRSITHSNSGKLTMGAGRGFARTAGLAVHNKEEPARPRLGGLRLHEGLPRNGERGRTTGKMAGDFVRPAALV